MPNYDQITLVLKETRSKSHYVCSGAQEKRTVSNKVGRNKVICLRDAQERRQHHSKTTHFSNIHCVFLAKSWGISITMFGCSRQNHRSTMAKQLQLQHSTTEQ
jgi:hypothetical protein